jgi:broad specificity phosphatase PhoE
LIKIFIARHGETTWNAEGKIQGRSDPGLSPKGYDQSMALLKQLKAESLSAIYTSTLRRSILTAEPTAKHFGLPIQPRHELDEIAFGVMEGKQIAQVDGELKMEWERFRENRFTYRIPGAENYTDVLNRISPFLRGTLQHHKDQGILIVGHRVVNLMLIRMLLDVLPEDIMKIEQTNDCLYRIERDGETRVFHYIDGEIREGFFVKGRLRDERRRGDPETG